MRDRLRTTLIVGAVAIAALVPLTIFGWAWLPFQIAGTMIMEHLPTPVLARALLGPTGGQVVADSRKDWPFRDGVGFFGRPQVSGVYTCAIPMWSVSAAITTMGRRRDVTPSMQSETRFRMITTDPPGCEENRDFTHTFSSDDPRSAEEFGRLIYAARRDARAGSVAYPVRCASELPPHKGEPCNGRAYLATLDFRRIRTVMRSRSDEVMALTADDGPFASYAYIDEGDINGHPLVTRLVIRARGGRYTEPEIVTGIEIYRDAH